MILASFFSPNLLNGGEFCMMIATKIKHLMRHASPGISKYEVLLSGVNNNGVRNKKPRE